MANRYSGGWRFFASLLITFSISFLVLLLRETGSQPADTDARGLSTASLLTARENGGRTGPVQQIGRRLASSFAIFRTGAERLPRDILAIVHRSPYGLNWNLAQRLPLPRSEAFWVVPGRKFICVLSSEEGDSVSETCTRSRYAVNSGIASVSITEIPQLAGGVVSRSIVGLVPGGSKRVQIETNGAVARPKVVKEVFRLHDSNPAPPDLIVPS